jgi:hypothetical protein
MTLSRIHLPSITSVLTSERVFLPGQFQSTKLDMGATETECLLSPDFLMVCRVIPFSVDLLNTQIIPENYSSGRSTLRWTRWTPGLLI